MERGCPCAQYSNRQVFVMAKRARVYFLTAYVEYLFDEGIRSEEYYLGDASRYMRWLLARATAADMDAYIEERAASASYRTRLRKTLHKFTRFAADRLHITQRADKPEPGRKSSRR